MENHQHAHNQESMQLPLQGLSRLQQPHLDFASHTDHQSYFNLPQPRNGQTQEPNTLSPMDNQPPRTEGSTHAVHAQLPVSSASFSNNASEGGLVGTPDLTELTCIIPHCSEVFVLFSDFSRHCHTAHPRLLEPDAHSPTVTNAASLPSDGANHTHIPTISTSMSQPMTLPIPNENCKIGPRMKPGDACEVCKKQKKKCQGATCSRAQRLVQAARMESIAPNATSGSQEWEDNQSASPEPTHVSSSTFTVMDGSMAEHVSSDPSSILPSFNTLSTGSNIVPLDLDLYLDHASPTAVPYLPPPITAADHSFPEPLYPDHPNPGPDRLPTSILQIPYYLINTSFSLLVESQARLAQRGLQTNEGLKQKLMLPSAWNSDDCCKQLVLSNDGMAVEYKGTVYRILSCSAIVLIAGLWKGEYTRPSVRSNYSIPPQCGLFYWEVNHKFKCPNSSISVGVRSRASDLEGAYDFFDTPYWYNTREGTVSHWHKSSGRHKSIREFGPGFFMGDTIGYGTAFKALSSQYPLISQYPLYLFVKLDNPGDQVEANFGARAFKFDVLRYMKL
ncbi:hypothetical protein BC937DRAFT_92841 [Endogone sp. FLAS-F59071]|nr:hypothetical protein BC937DRAFT_92841 [Endogone sp. FLAS-F59071]|eukprot:RUS21388.1 hypothetical protein BC937DRAFT_92841 [Endogone sp. FLAS-F59071]